MSLVDEVTSWRRCEEEIPLLTRARELCGAETSLSPADCMKRLFVALREQIGCLPGLITPENIRDRGTRAQVYRLSCLCDILGRSRFFRRVPRLNMFEPLSHMRYSGAAARLSKRARSIRDPVSYVWDTDIAAPPAPQELVLRTTAYEALRAGDYVEATSGEERDTDEAIKHPLEQEIEPLVAEWTHKLVQWRLGGLSVRRGLLLW
ncbi:hypothetical protein GLOTRDRAFT_93891 [Gloeophyllum trabeum ATCC 11539]|uniref:Uncharacterized protein n=1 Tax=Gloeophyllum trabeum (strain ATCC 11539 / FP-39264 / Madison 617) TaxID=670483 RepID=S7Q7D9_GLOTA|nr:uncharacterized protein GLOTRDRAFT_93891 [Gloeophyllum trabeum ATCC 11539]EPQ55447.1 hypothetical protein GLOTRDRAFT_93891 [Gloeophyllum trabeum ATCC 11539]